MDGDQGKGKILYLPAGGGAALQVGPEALTRHCCESCFCVVITTNKIPLRSHFTSYQQQQPQQRISSC